MVAVGLGLAKSSEHSFLSSTLSSTTVSWLPRLSFAAPEDELLVPKLITPGAQLIYALFHPLHLIFVGLRRERIAVGGDRTVKLVLVNICSGHRSSPRQKKDLAQNYPQTQLYPF
jgi:hypothetical protein